MERMKYIKEENWRQEEEGRRIKAKTRYQFDLLKRKKANNILMRKDKTKYCGAKARKK